MAKCYRGLDLEEGLKETSGCVSLRSAHLQVASMRALKKWRLWRLISGMLSLRQMAAIRGSIFDPSSNGIRVGPTVFGDRTRRPMSWTMIRRRFLKP